MERFQFSLTESPQKKMKIHCTLKKNYPLESSSQFLLENLAQILLSEAQCPLQGGNNSIMNIFIVICHKIFLTKVLV